MDNKEKERRLLQMMEEEQKKIRNSTANQKKPEQLQESLSHSSSNLTRCPDCGREVSIRASACPHCGCPVDIKFQKAEITRRIKQEEKVLSEEEEFLENKIAKLKTIIDPVKKREFRFFCYTIATGLFCWIAAIWAWEIIDERMNGVSIMGMSGHTLSAIVIFLILLIVWTIKTPVLQDQKKELEVLESRLEENKRYTERLVDNQKNINSPKVFATLAAGYGLHQMRGIRQEMGEINESIADGGGDALGGDGGAGDVDFSSFM